MYDHTFYKQVQISRSDIRPHIKWAVNLVILHMVTSIFLWALCGYIWVNILTLSPRGYLLIRKSLLLCQKYCPLLLYSTCYWQALTSQLTVQIDTLATVTSSRPVGHMWWDITSLMILMISNNQCKVISWGGHICTRYTLTISQNTCLPTVIWQNERSSPWKQFAHHKGVEHSYQTPCYHYHYRTVGGDGGCRVSEVWAGTTSPMPDHKCFKLQ